MRTTIEIKGFPELVLEKAVKIGLARSKTDAIKLGILSLNDKHQLVTDIKEINDKHIVTIFKKQEEEMKTKGQKYITHEEVLKKYGHLLKSK